MGCPGATYCSPHSIVMGLQAQKVLMRPLPSSLHNHHIAAGEFGESATDTGAKGTSTSCPRHHLCCQGQPRRYRPAARNLQCRTAIVKDDENDDDNGDND